MTPTDEPNEEGAPPDEDGLRYRRFYRRSERASTDEPSQEQIVSPVEPEPKDRRRFHRSRALAERLRPRTMRGLLVLLALVGGIGAVVTIGGVMSLKYSESAGFCARCHTMRPEIKAHELSAHRDVACGECHVKSGIRGWLEAKMNGAKQTLEIVTGSYPKPIPQPEHDLLPPVKDTCMRCHSLADITKDNGPMKLILRPRYRKDRANTREMVAVVVRPGGLGNGGITRGAHSHVEQKIEFASRDKHSRKIDWVSVTSKNGRSKEYISSSKVRVSADVRSDIAQLKQTETSRQMDCIDCHNRVGHDIPSPDQAIDNSIAASKISQGLPDIKREGVIRTSASYPSTEAAARAIAGIRKTYAAKYPLVLKNRGRAVSGAIDELERIYQLSATPEMKVTAKTYLSNLGHRATPGCFRCHDGGHYQVVNGRVTDKTIPWACTTCHTFPQVGPKVSSVSLLGEPANHKAGLWVFNHKRKVSSLNTPGPTCGACHKASYCENCHRAGAAKVTHDEMYFNHPGAIANAGRQACNYCHQSASCARCHKPGSKPTAAPPAHLSPVALRRRE